MERCSEDELGLEDDGWPVLESGPGFVVESRPEGPSLDCTGGWSPEATDVMRSGRVRGLTLSYTSGFAEPDLEFIEPWPIEMVMLIDRTMRDIRPLERLAEVRDVFIQAAPQATVDVRRWPVINKFGGAWSHVRQTLPEARLPLRVLGIWSYGSTDLGDLTELTELQELELLGASQLSNLDGVGRLPLKSLKVASARNLKDITGLGDLSGVERVELESCRAVGRLPEFRDGCILKELWLDDCGKIETLLPLASCQELELLVMSGDTSIVDGDLSPLVSIPALKTLRTPYRKHYNIDPATIASSS